MTLFWFLLSLIILISIHEFGHFIVARACGVKVLRFSLGFGKVLASKRDKKGTEYVISILPLGGYVKMLDEEEGSVPKNQVKYAFNNQSVWKRIGIVAAGPLFNLLFAMLCFWLIFVTGVKTVAPIIGDVNPGSIAETVGFQKQDEIIEVNEKPILSWIDFQYAMLPFVGTNEVITIGLKSKTNQERIVKLALKEWHLGQKNQDLLAELGLIPFLPKAPFIVGDVTKDSPAAKAGIELGDKIERINGKIIHDSIEVAKFIQKNPNAEIQLTILRQGALKNMLVVLGSMNKGQQGFLGVRSLPMEWPKEWLRIQRENPLTALYSAYEKTLDLTWSTFSLFGRLITGQLQLQVLTGPIGIAEGAGASVKGGLIGYLTFLALVSVSLGALNLLPIPMLDGGHLFYYFLEILRRKPLSIKVRAFASYIGLFFLLGMMCLSLFNDIYRLAG